MNPQYRKAQQSQGMVRVNEEDILSLLKPSLLDILIFLESRYIQKKQSYTFLGQLLLSLRSNYSSDSQDILSLYDPCLVSSTTTMPAHVWKLCANIVHSLWNSESNESTTTPSSPSSFPSSSSHHTIYLTGKCGSGKSYNLKLIIQYLSYFCYSISSMKISPSHIQPRIESITSLLNPFIEAIHGMNFNSTRCGSHIRFIYDSKFNYHGIYLDIFGLETNRLTSTSMDSSQSSYHLFYMICYEQSRERIEKYYLHLPNYYKILHTTTHHLHFSSNVMDNFYFKKYQEFLHGLDVLTKDSDLIMDGLLRAISAILTINNIEYDSTLLSILHDTTSTSSSSNSSATPPSTTTLENEKYSNMIQLFHHVANLLDIDVLELISSLTTRTVVISLESITITLTAEQCSYMTDIFCKTLYLSVCQWFVSLLNTELFYYDCTGTTPATTTSQQPSHHQPQQPPGTGQYIDKIEDIWKLIMNYLNSTQQHKRFSNNSYAKGVSSHATSSGSSATSARSPYQSIGILDMFGLENISNDQQSSNSLEQLLSNYSSEKMQHSFEKYILREQNFYYDEGIHWDTIEISNSCQLAIQLIHNKLITLPSLISTLDEMSLSMNSSSTSSSSTSLSGSEISSFLDQTFHEFPAFLTTSLNKIKGEFTIRHYSQTVTYQLANFLSKNQTYYFPLEDLLAPSNNNCMRQYANIFSIYYGDNLTLSSTSTSSASCSSTSTSLYHLRQQKQQQQYSNLQSKSFFNLLSYSTSQLFCQSIDDILTTLALTESHHLKCLIPFVEEVDPHTSALLAPPATTPPPTSHEIFSRNNLLSQMRSEGVITAFNLFSAVYPIQFTYQEFWMKYEPLILDILTEERIHMTTISEQIIYQSTHPTNKRPKKKEWINVLSELENKMNCEGIALKKVIPRVADFSNEKKRRHSLGRLSNNLVNELAITLAALRSQGLGGGKDDDDDENEEMSGDPQQQVMRKKYSNQEEDEPDGDVDDKKQDMEIEKIDSSHHIGKNQTIIKLSDDAKLSAGVDALITRYERWQQERNVNSKGEGTPPQGTSLYDIQRGKSRIFMKEQAYQWLITMDHEYLRPRRAAMIIQEWFRHGNFRQFVNHKYTRRKLFSRVVIPLQRIWRWKSSLYHQLINEEKWQQKKKQLLEKSPITPTMAYSKQSPLDLYKHDDNDITNITTTSSSSLLLANRTVLWVIFSHYMDSSVSKSGTIPIKRKYVIPIVTSTALCELLRDWGIIPQVIPLSTVEILISEAILRTSSLDTSRSSTTSSLSSASASTGKKKISQSMSMISYTGFTTVLLLIAVELENHHHQNQNPRLSTTTSTPTQTQTMTPTPVAAEERMLTILKIKESDLIRANPLEYCVRGLKIILTSMDHSKGRQKFISSRSSVIVPAFCTTSGVKNNTITTMNKDLPHSSPPVKVKDAKILNITAINTHSSNTSKKTSKELQYPPMTPQVHDIFKKNEQTLVAMAFSYGTTPSSLPPPSPQLQTHLSADTTLNTPSSYAEFATLKTIQRREAVSITLDGIWNMLKDFEICPKFCSKSLLKEIFQTIANSHQILSTTSIPLSSSSSSSNSTSTPVASLSYTGYIEVLNCVAQNFIARGTPEDKLRNMFYAMNMSTGRSKCVSKRLSGILPPLQIPNSVTSPVAHTPTHRGRDSIPATPTSGHRHRRASTGTSLPLTRAHSRSLSPKHSRTQSVSTTSSSTWFDSNNDNLLHWLSDVLKDDNGVKISHEALLDVHSAFQRAYITTVSALAAIPESDMTYTELKSLGIGPLGVRTMIISAHKKLLQSRNNLQHQTTIMNSKTEARRRGSEDSTSSSTPTTPKATRSAASQLFSKVSLSESPEQSSNPSSIQSPSPQLIQPEVKILGNLIYVSVSKPLGMNLAENVPDEPLGVHIEKIVPDGNASQCGVLRSGYILREVCGKYAMEMEFDDIMEILRDAPFDTPIKMIFIDPTKNEAGEDIRIDNPDEPDKNETDEDDERRSFSFDDEKGEEDEDEQKNKNEENDEIEMNIEEKIPRRPLLLRRKSSLT